MNDRRQRRFVPDLSQVTMRLRGKGIDIKPYQEIERIYQGVEQEKDSFEELKAALGKYEAEHLWLVKFFYAKYKKKKGQYEMAGSLIAEAIEVMETVDNLAFILGVRDYVNAVYQLAGEIYANKDERSEALKAYQNYQLRVSQLKGCDVEHCLSFRRYNEYTLSDLVNNELTLCSPWKMNDPYDTLLLKWGEYLENNQDKKHIGPVCEAFELYRIRSFAKEFDEKGNEMVGNILMWSHYAEQHSGFCIKYRFPKSFHDRTEDHAYA